MKFIFAFLFLCSLSALAENLQCGMLFSDNVVVLKAGSPRLYDSYYSFSFKNFKKVLFLSNGGNGLFTEKTDPTQLIVSTEYQYKKNTGINVLIDNNSLPFKENTFDVIFMNRGLCFCKGSGNACAGIGTQYDSMKNFLLDSIRILDKTHGNSVAIFTGYNFPGVEHSGIPKLWRSILNELKLQFPEIQFAVLEADNDFMGLAISTGPQPINKTMNQLNHYLVPEHASVLAPVSQ
ncbi:MAG: hypothetical protein A4S09_09990 [Proteobacteria bacterium SG_bin7]|nr:MAG: hypothetical protein A4S09_09990 [Proteobacteria bacterium SG_bin7]